MDILKDASSTAIYGSKGSAGVILINTKRFLEAHYQRKYKNRCFTKLLYARRCLLLNGICRERVDYFKTIDYFKPGEQQHGLGYYDIPIVCPVAFLVNNGQVGSSFRDYIETWMQRLEFNPSEVNNYKAGKFVDWMDLVYQNGLRQDYNASVSGKTARTNYYVSLGYTNNDRYHSR